MKVILFTLLAYGITNIIVFGSIFESFRNACSEINKSFLGKLVTCPLCLSTWVGGILSFIFIKAGCLTPFSMYGVDNLWLTIFFDACFTSGCVWLIHTIQEALERSNYN